MKKMKSKTWSKCPGKGWMAIITIKSDDMLPKVGDKIIIDGFTYTVNDLGYKMISNRSKQRHPDVCVTVNEPPLHRHFEVSNE